MWCGGWPEHGAGNIAGMSAPAIHVACLCAAWCRTCEGYRGVFERVAREAAAGGAEWQRHWIDIEDEADLVGDIDVETFPTILIVDATQVRFAGAITPEPETLARLLRARLVDADPGARWPAVAGEVLDLAARLRQRGGAPDGGR